MFNRKKLITQKCNVNFFHTITRIHSLTGKTTVDNYCRSDFLTISTRAKSAHRLLKVLLITKCGIFLSPQPPTSQQRCCFHSPAPLKWLPFCFANSATNWQLLRLLSAGETQAPRDRDSQLHFWLPRLVRSWNQQSEFLNRDKQNTCFYFFII